MSEVPEVSGPRVHLRPFRQSDIAERFHLGQAPEIVRCFGGDPNDLPPYTEDHARQWVERHLNHPMAWAVEVDGRLLGEVRLDNLHDHDRRARLAIGLFDVDQLGRGLGRDAIDLVLSYAFGALDLHRIDLRVLASNERAIRCYKACGFVEEGRERESAYVAGAWEDDVIMAILAREHRGNAQRDPDENGWKSSAEAWIKRTGDIGDFSRQHVLDTPMLARVAALKPQMALDVGCGEGRFCRMLSDMGVSTVGMDPVDAMIEEARRRHRGGTYLTGFAEALPFDDRSFDLVVSYLTLIDIDALQDAVSEMARVLRPGGRAPAPLGELPERGEGLARMGWIARAQLAPAAFDIYAGLFERRDDPEILRGTGPVRRSTRAGQLLSTNALPDDDGVGEVRFDETVTVLKCVLGFTNL